MLLGNALATLGNDGKMVVERFKPMLVGKDPMAENLASHDWLGYGWCHAGHWCNRCRPLGSGRQGGRCADPLFDGLIEIVFTLTQAPLYSKILRSMPKKQWYKEAGWQAYKIHPPAVAAWDIKI